MSFLELYGNFQNSYVKEQSHFHAVGTLEETNGLLKDSIRSALSLVIYNICKFYLFIYNFIKQPQSVSLKFFMLGLNSQTDLLDFL